MKWCMCNPNITKLPWALTLSTDALNTRTHACMHTCRSCKYWRTTTGFLEAEYRFALVSHRNKILHPPLRASTAAPPVTLSLHRLSSPPVCPWNAPAPCHATYWRPSGVAGAPLHSSLSLNKAPGTRRTNSPSPHSCKGFAPVPSTLHVLSAT